MNWVMRRILMCSHQGQSSEPTIWRSTRPACLFGTTVSTSRRPLAPVCILGLGICIGDVYTRRMATKRKPTRKVTVPDLSTAVAPLDTFRAFIDEALAGKHSPGERYTRIISAREIGMITPEKADRLLDKLVPGKKP